MGYRSKNMIHAAGDYGYQAFRGLQSVFVISLLLAGFCSIIYPGIYVPYLIAPLPFIRILGGIEIFLGIGLVFFPWIFAYMLSVFFFIIAMTFSIKETHYLPLLEIFCLIISSFSLGKLSQKYMPP